MRRRVLVGFWVALMGMLLIPIQSAQASGRYRGESYYRETVSWRCPYCSHRFDCEDVAYRHVRTCSSYDDYDSRYRPRYRSYYGSRSRTSVRVRINTGNFGFGYRSRGGNWGRRNDCPPRFRGGGGYRRGGWRR